MKIRVNYTVILAGLLMASASAVSAESISLNAFKPRVLPVLVQVDATGKVVDVSPSSKLSPTFDRLLHQTLDAMISKPAMVKGHPVSSQFVMNLAMRVTPRADGKYDARFVYVSTSPVPSGSWYWVHQDGDRVALAPQGGFLPRQRIQRPLGDDAYPNENYTPPRQSAPPAQATGRSMAAQPTSRPGTTHNLN